MFQDVLLETAPAERQRRKLTLAITLLGEALVIAVLVGIPLLYLDALPGLSLRPPSTPISIGATPHFHDSGISRPSGASHPTNNSIAVFRAFNPHPALPWGRPQQYANSGNGTNDPVGTGVCCADPNLPFIPGSNYVVPPVLKPTTGPKLISHLDEGMIIKRVDPVYPMPAKIAGVQGEVTLRATIGTSGQLEGLQVVSGHPLLINAAVAAVQQWRFRPYVLNGSPIEVQSQITVKFVLQR